jgi:hypothetical protein
MNYIRTLVSGKKLRFKDRRYNLDLSYITPRIIAMAFPGAGLEKIIRNSIDDVSLFLNERHGSNYLVINLSGKKYDKSKFKNKVKKKKFIIKTGIRI